MALVDNNNSGGTNNADVQYLRFDFRGVQPERIVVVNVENLILGGEGVDEVIDSDDTEDVEDEQTSEHTVITRGDAYVAKILKQILHKIS